MAKREWLIPVEDGGTEESDRYGAALGLIAGGELVRSLTEIVSMMHRQGGQVYIAAVNALFDQDGHRIDRDDDETPGTWQHVGYHVSYETRDLRLRRLKPPPDEIDIDEPDPEPE